MKNLNLIFNKIYYSKLNTVFSAGLDSENATTELSKDIEHHNNQICSVVFNHEKDYKGLSKDIATHQFLMETVYPGLIIGSGNPHGAQLCVNDINVGFSFEYVSGQPYIPGSSVKGALRSCFKDSPDAVSEILKSEFPDFTKNIKELEKEIFEGKDIFFDAVIYAGDARGRILDTDSITPHSDEIKAPKPILILKLIPGVRLNFSFRFFDGILTSEEKCRLMRIILSIFGIGAKTNTGYGRLEFTENKDITIVSQTTDDSNSDTDTIICRDCKKTYKLNDFEKSKVKNENWKIVRCPQCRKKRKQQ